MSNAIRRYGVDIVIEGLGLRSLSYDPTSKGSGFRVQSSGFKVQGSGFGDSIEMQMNLYP